MIAIMASASFSCSLLGRDRELAAVRAELAAAAAGSTAPAQLLPYAAYRLAVTLLEHSQRVAAQSRAHAARDRAQQIGCGLIVRRVDEFLAQAGLAGRLSPAAIRLRSDTEFVE